MQSQRSRKHLPQIGSEIFLHYVGLETELIFREGLDLPGFASYPLLETDDGRELLRDYYRKLLKTGHKTGLGVMLDSVTWVANRARGGELGYGRGQLRDLNIAAVKLISDMRDEYPDVKTILSAQMGPRGDGYAPSDLMGEAEAEAFHLEQMQTLSHTNADLVSAFTLCYPQEATGIVRAGMRHQMPVAVSFTVETDGRLPDGTPLGEAIKTVDAATSNAAEYFLVNCAHPEHIIPALSDEPWSRRLRGIVANASRCSHAELDNATELDAGDPEDLGQLCADIRQQYPHFNIFGGCCGTNMHHLTEIAGRITA